MSGTHEHAPLIARMSAAYDLKGPLGIANVAKGICLLAAEENRGVDAKLATEYCFVSFNLHRDPKERDQFMFYELWTDEPRHMEVLNRAYFQTYLKDRVALIEEKVERITSALERVAARSGG